MKSMNYFTKIFKIILNLLLPPRCVFCGTIMPADAAFFVCGGCEGKLPVPQGKCCKLCGRPIDIVYGPLLCHDCRHTKRKFAKAYAPFVYEGLVKNAIIKYKFNKKTYAKSVFSYYLCEKIKEIDYFDAIAYVPLSKKRLKKRGYNQSLLLAEEISKKFEKPILHCLTRIKETEVQSKLKRADRIKNVKNAFKVCENEGLQGKTILLIDDVFTTGATSNECCGELIRSGAKKVYVGVVAVGKGSW